MRIWDGQGIEGCEKHAFLETVICDWGNRQNAFVFFFGQKKNNSNIFRGKTTAQNDKE